MKEDNIFKQKFLCDFKKYFGMIKITTKLFFVALILVSFSQPVDNNKDKIKKRSENNHLSKDVLAIPPAGNNDPQRPDYKGSVLFTDWFSVWPGNIGYGGKDIVLTEKEVYSKGVSHQVDVPRGVELVVQEAEIYGPVMQADKPWESRILTASVLRDEYDFKMWYIASYTVSEEKVIIDDVTAGKIDVSKSMRFLCYAESKDGFTWHKPDLGLYEFAGSTANNIICEEESTDNVFFDRNGNYRRLVSDGAPIIEGAADKAMYSYTSTDGIHWTLDGPVMDMMCDTQNNGFYDKLYGKYVLYVRYARGTRRAIAMTEGSEFSVDNLPLPQIVYEPDTQDSPSIDFYSIAYSRHPDYFKVDNQSSFLYSTKRDNRGRLDMVRHHDARDMHFMFSSVFHRDRDVIDVQLAVSRDGRQWSRPERKAIIPCVYNGEAINTIYAFPGLHLLKPSLWGMMYSASERPHNAGFVTSYGENKYFWATWKENRLVALQAKDEGMCTVKLTGCNDTQKKEIRLNYQTEKYGWIRIELISSGGLHPPTGPKIIEGYSFNDCDPLVGDSLYQSVTWNGSTELPSHANTLRIHMYRAKLFAIEWE